MTTAEILRSVDPETVRRTTLPNGLRVLVREDRSAPVVAIVTYVSAGYFDEPDDVVGIAHVLEHMYFKGTASRGVGEIAKQTKAVGGYLNAATIYDHTSYYTVLPASGFAAGLDVQYDAYANSLIDAEELKRELEVIVQEAKRKADTPHAVAVETLYELLHDCHRIRRWRIGRERQLRALTRDAMLAFYRNFYRPANTVLSIVGSVDADEAIEHVARRYGVLPAGTPTRTPGPTEPADGEFRYREWTGDIEQTQLAFGWRTPGTLHPDTPHLELLATVLGTGRASRLYRAVRDRRLASSVTAYDYTPTELGVFVIHAETPPEASVAAARTIWNQVEAICGGDVGDLEVERAKRIYESRWIRRMEDMEGQANFLAEWEALGDWRLGDRYLERVLTARRDDIVDVARRYLQPHLGSVLVYRPDGSREVAGRADAMKALLASEPSAALTAAAPYAAHASYLRTPAVSLEREDAGVRVYRTAGGVPVLVRRKPGAPLVHLGVYILGGSSDEGTAVAGLTTLMVRTALKGTSRRTALQIAEEAEMLGGSIAGSAGVESFGWSLSVPTRHAAAAIELLADVVQFPIFLDEAYETERSVAIADVVALRDDMYRYPVWLATQAAFRDHPYGTPPMGTEESLASIGVDRVREWHRGNVVTASSVIALVGDGDPDELAALATAAFDNMRSAPAARLPTATWPTRVVERVDSREKAQTALALLFAGPNRADGDRFAAEMIATVVSGLGGRFFDELRDRQSLCYAVQAFISERRAAGSFGTYIATSPDKEDRARDGLLGEFGKLRAQPVTDEELTRAKTYAVGVHAIRQQNGGAMLSDLVGAFLFGSLRELIEYEDRVRAVTPEDMQRVADRYFRPDRRVEGIVRGTSRTV